MRTYLIPIMGMCFAVDGLLLLAANKLTRGPGQPLQMLLGALLGALYAGACVQYKLQFPGRIGCLVLMAVVSFGISLRGVMSAGAYLVMSMATGFLAGALGGSRGDLAVAAVMVTLLCGLWMLQKQTDGGMVPVKLRYGKSQLSITALRDTGNTLRDPMTGDSVLVLGADAAKALLGLEVHQLQDPVSTLVESKISGLRLIPYRTVSGKGLLLALRIPDAQIGNTRKSTVVAFAPIRLGVKEGFQGLTGGTI